MRQERDHIGFDPVKWVERLRDVNADSQFPVMDKDLIERMLAELQRLLEQGYVA